MLADSLAIPHELQHVDFDIMPRQQRVQGCTHGYSNEQSQNQVPIILHHLAANKPNRYTHQQRSTEQPSKLE